ncbi:MAG: hypothetical protein HY901_17650 [Deltaproteobacteria bacterium]|nr:hypothetical protein [Deltaproteobacteria bacterium]
MLPLLLALMAAVPSPEPQTTHPPDGPWRSLPVIDLERTVRKPLSIVFEPTTGGKRACERLRLRYENGAVFAEGTLCEPARGNRARTFWQQEGPITFWHPNGQKLGEVLATRTRYWTADGVLVGELRKGAWRPGPAMGQALTCDRGEQLLILGPKLSGEHPKFRRELAPPFTLVCRGGDGDARLVRMVWSDGQVLFDGARFFYPNGTLAMEVDGQPFRAGMNGLDMRPRRCFSSSGAETPYPLQDGHDWATVPLFRIREQGQLTPLPGAPSDAVP